MPKTNQSTVQDAVRVILESIGENPDREGLKETPRRVAKYYEEFFNPPDFNLTTFPSEGHDSMVIVKDIPFNSLCEHHMLPFIGVGHIAYIPNGRIVGLSKLPRTLEWYSRRLQNQERITNQVGEFLMSKLGAKGVAVSLSARHFCMELRGVKKVGSFTRTTCLLGVFENESDAKQEFLNQINDKM